MVRRMGNACEEPVRSRRSIKQRIVLAIFIALLTATYTEKHFVETPLNQRWDFETFYFAAKMVRSGEGPRLYDLSVQTAYQNRFVGDSRVVKVSDQPFFYPAATAILFLPMAWLPRVLAFAVWTATSLILLVLTVRLLQRHLPIPQDDRTIFAALLFVPVYVCLLHGQLAILLLFLYAVAFSLFKRGKPFAAGFALGLGTLKFQLMVGFFVILLLRRYWKALSGVAAGGFVIASASAAILGWRGLLDYPITLLQVAHLPAFDALSANISLRGLLTTASGGHPPQAWILVILSAVVIVAPALLRSDFDVVFAAAIVASVLVAYHAFFQELTLLLLPAAVIASRLTRERLIWSLGLTWIMTAILAFGGTALGVAALMFQAPAAVAFATVVGGLWHARSQPPALNMDTGDVRTPLQEVSS